MKDVNFDFDSLALQEKPVRYKGKDYVLREADEDTARKYHNFRARGLRIGPEGTLTGIDLPNDMADIRSIVLGGCLFPMIKIGKDQEEVVGPRPIGETEIRKWPSRFTQPMFDWVKEVSGLDSTGGDEGKNLPDDTVGGSE